VRERHKGSEKRENRTEEEGPFKKHLKKFKFQKKKEKNESKNLKKNPSGKKKEPAANIISQSGGEGS